MTFACRTCQLVLHDGVDYTWCPKCNGTVDWIEHLGDQTHLHVKIGERKLITLAPPDTPLSAGDAVTIRYRNPLCFDAGGDRLGGVQ